MTAEKENKYLVTGKPGSGKTTTIKRIAEELKDNAVGFYTAEIKESKSRLGFEIISFSSGLKAPLAHVDFKSSKKVGKYGVCPENLHPFLDELEEALKDQNRKLILIDEIGKMELFSPRFKELVFNAFESHHPLVATILFRPEPFCDGLKQRPDVKMFELDHSNRDQLPFDLLARVKERLDQSKTG